MGHIIFYSTRLEDIQTLQCSHPSIWALQVHYMLKTKDTRWLKIFVQTCSLGICFKFSYYKKQVSILNNVLITFIQHFFTCLASPLPNCNTMPVGTAFASMVGAGTSSFLFLRRIQAVYVHSKSVKFTFFALWLVQIGLSVLLLLGVSGFLTAE